MIKVLVFLIKQTKQYEKIKIIKQVPGLFLGCNIYDICIIMDIHHKFLPLNRENISLSQEEIKKVVRESCNNFLKTKRGFHYLLMKYPHLSVSQAINEYIKNALWIDSIV